MLTTIKFVGDLPNNNCNFGIYVKEYISDTFNGLCIKYANNFNPGYFLDCSKNYYYNSRYIVSNYDHIFSLNSSNTVKLLVEEKNAKNNTHYLLCIDFIINIVDDVIKSHIVKIIDKLCKKIDEEMEKITYEYEYDNCLFEFNERQIGLD